MDEFYNFRWPDPMDPNSQAEIIRSIPIEHRLPGNEDTSTVTSISVPALLSFYGFLHRSHVSSVDAADAQIQALTERLKEAEELTQLMRNYFEEKEKKEELYELRKESQANADSWRVHSTLWHERFKKLRCWCHCQPIENDPHLDNLNYDLLGVPYENLCVSCTRATDDIRLDKVLKFMRSEPPAWFERWWHFQVGDSTWVFPPVDGVYGVSWKDFEEVYYKSYISASDPHQKLPPISTASGLGNQQVSPKLTGNTGTPTTPAMPTTKDKETDVNTKSAKSRCPRPKHRARAREYAEARA
ncbi:hypothetical protein BZA05DRAFT_443977 [Tricharina praecox]|uniref:uncharacterized protein n=1 Tax=Tricharina praecox TaxID=43433 RepID=UPI00221FAE38|nr:uncharacterized protein BZA05DRAFT_443977 [Tricharina praecox]KAI5853685.1 hypothetical protein BZA05DRAFT_443977 [Tricharina praecox]